MKSLLHALVLLGWCAWLASEYLAFGSASYIRQHDAAEVNTPFYTALARLDAARLTGWWDPLAGTGVDALSNLKGDMPLVEALFRYAPHWSNSGILLLGQSFIAALGLFVLLRTRLQVDDAPALAAAAWFAFLPWTSLPHSGFPTWYGWYIPAFPLVVIALGWCAERRGRGAMTAAVVGGVLALGTPTASGLLVVPVAAAWVIAFAERARRRTAIVPLACFAVAFVIVKAPAIAALLANVPASQRVIRSAAALQPHAALEVWPSRWEDLRAIGVAHSVLIVVASLGLVAAGFRDRRLNLALGGMAALLGMTAAAPLLQPLLALAGDSFRSYQIDRINRFFPVVAAVASALSLHLLRRADRRLAAVRTGAWTLMLASLAAASVWMNAGREARRTAGNRYDAFFDQPTLQQLAAERRAGEPFRVATLADRNAGAHGRHPAFAWAYGLETADMYVTTYPLRYHEFWSRVIAPVRDRRPDIRAYFDNWGSMAYLFNPAAPLFGPAAAAGPTLAGLPFNLDLLSLANVRYILSAVPLRDERLTLRPDSRGVLVYENAGVLPRLFVAHRSRAFTDEAELLATLAQTSAAELRKTAFVAGPHAEGAAARPHAVLTADASVHVRDYTADVIRVDVITPAPGVLVATNAFSEFWAATVDGAEVPVFPVYHAFQGVAIQSGAHAVELRYRPPYGFGGGAQPLLLAALVAMAGAAGICAARWV